jgi:flagellar basal-body rod modification protein FlgD
MTIAPTTTEAAGAAAIAQINAQGRTSSGNSALASAQEQSDRFLTLLVTQMKNQDPLNPMDNAQSTTQMAQISTVSGIDKLAGAVTGMNGLLMQMQSLEAAGLVGKDVLVAGNRLSPAEDGATQAGFELAGAARSVVVTIQDAGGRVVDTLDLGAQPQGRHSFDWSAPAGSSGLTFTVSARNGTDTVGSTPLVADRVEAVYVEQGQLTVELRRNGSVKYSDVKAVS